MNRYTELFRRRASDRNATEFLPIEVEEPKPPGIKPSEEVNPPSEDKMHFEETPKKREVLPNH